MQAQIFHIHCMEIIFRGAEQHFPKTRHNPARKYVFLYPRVALMLFQTADKMEQE